MKLRNRFLISTLVAAALLFSLWWYYRWYHYPRKILFYNTYSTGREGAGAWNWRLWPAPSYDDNGRMLLYDSQANMLAVVISPDRPPHTGYQGGPISNDSWKLSLGTKWVIVNKSPDSLVQVDSAGEHFVRHLGPHEAERTAAAVETADIGPDGRQAVSKMLDALLAPLTTTKPSTSAK